MLKILNIKELLLFAIIFISASFSFAQVVTVPVGCVVKEPGTGGSIALNQVGNGGVITMPDGYLGGTFSCTTPTGTTLNSWSLRGDLSVTTTNVPPAAVIQPVGTLSSYSIQSYNKNLRTSFEGLAGSAASTLAKSKGKVTINYTSGVCSGQTLSFDVYKTYTVVPPAIVGPACITANVPCTFSLDIVASDNTPENIGFDQYYWSFVDNLGFSVALPILTGSEYYSADGSSFTFTPTSSTAFKIKCCVGRANPWDGGLGLTQPAAITGTACVTKNVGVGPQAPVLLSGGLRLSNRVCIQTGVNPLVVTYNPPPAGTTYTWTTPNNWPLSFVNGTQVTMNVALDNNPGELRLKVTNSCTSIDFVYYIVRSFTNAISISPANGCFAAGTANSFSIGPNAASNGTDWTITPAPTVGSFTITYPNSFSSTPTITSTANVPVGQYTLTAYSTAVNFKGIACGGAITTTFNISPPAPVFLATSPTCILKGSTPITTIQVDTSVVGTPTTGYIWNISGAPGWTISAGATTSTPTFVPSGTNSGPVTISVVRAGTIGCNSAAAVRIINYILINTNLNSSTSFCDQYALSCGTLTSWVVNGNVINPLSLPPNITIATGVLSICGNGTQVVSVCANVVGVPTLVCANPVGTHGLRPSLALVNNGTKLPEISIYPNPNKGEFFIKVDSLKQGAGASVTDSSGKLLGTFELVKGENRIAIPNLIQGVYSVNLIKDGKQEVRQIIIE